MLLFAHYFQYNSIIEYILFVFIRMTRYQNVRSTQFIETAEMSTYLSRAIVVRNCCYSIECCRLICYHESKTVGHES